MSTKLSNWIGVYKTKTGSTWGNFFQDLVILQNGTMYLAGALIVPEYNEATSELTFDWSQVKDTQAKGSIQFSQEGNERSFSGVIHPRLSDGPVSFSGQDAVAEEGIAKWVGVYEASTQWWNGFFSPLVVLSDGKMNIAGSVISPDYDASTSTISFDWVQIKDTTALGKIGFKDDNNHRSFAGSINPRKKDGGVRYTGEDARETVLQQA